MLTFSHLASLKGRNVKHPLTSHLKLKLNADFRQILLKQTCVNNQTSLTFSVRPSATACKSRAVGATGADRR